MTWITGLIITLLLPLVIVLMAHGVVNIPLFAAQGTVIFLFFAWVTSAQAIFSLYRLEAVASWKVSAMMVATLSFIGLTYLWAGETFTHFLYPAPGEAAAYFQAAAWHPSLFDAFVAALSAPHRPGVGDLVWQGPRHTIYLPRPARHDLRPTVRRVSERTLCGRCPSGPRSRPKTGKKTSLGQRPVPAGLGWVG